MSEAIKEAAAPIEENAEQISRGLIEQILDHGDGEVKSASTAGTNMIRRRIREEGFTRRLIPPETKTNEDLDRVLEHERPIIIEDMEPRSRGAKTVPFGEAADSATFYANRFAVDFNPITTPEFFKDINELRTTRMDLRKVITDNSLNDLQTEEDGSFLSLCDTIVGSVGGNGAAGVPQNFQIAGGFTRENYVDALNLLENADINTPLNNGVILMNRKTAKNFLKFDRTEIGGDLSEEMFKSGLTALQEATVFGVKHIFTIKRNLVADNVIYIFTEPGYLGRFYELQSTLLYVEKKKDFLRFSAREVIGVTIANVMGVVKCQFV